MSNDNLDRLFEQKLSGHQVAPPPAAWNKLETRLQKERKPFWLWSRIAAALLLLAVCGWLVISLVNDSTTSGPNEIAEQNQVTQPSAPIASDQENAMASKQEDQPVGEAEQNDEPILETNDNKIKTAPLANDPEIAPSNSKPTLENKSDSQLLATQTPKPELVGKTIETNQDVAIVSEEHEEPPIAEETTLALAEVTEDTAIENAATEETKRAPVRITYKRSSTPAQQTLLADNNETKETTGIGRAWQKAKNIKNNELSIGKLRAAKDNLLAFRGDKNKQSKSN